MSDELTGRESGAILTRLEHFERRFDEIKSRLDEIDERLERGDRRFRLHDLERARATAIHKLMLWIGRGVLTLVGGGVLWIFTRLVENWWVIWFPPKH